MIEKFISTLRVDKLNFDDISIILDIGSRDGLQSIEFSNIFHQAKIFAIEGNSDNANRLRVNISDYPSIHCLEAVVTDYDGEATFYKIDPEKTVTPHEDGNPGASSLYIANPDYPLETYVQVPTKVPCSRIDTLLKKLDVNNVDLIWMDLQGAEIDALNGMGQILKSVKYIYTEVTHREIYKGQPLFEVFEDYMLSQGFERISKIDNATYFEDAIYRNMSYKTSSPSSMVLSQPWGGLGDNLQYSTLPKICHENGIDFYLSRDNSCRNADIESLVWADNPYLKGISSKPANSGAMLCDLSKYSPAYSFIENIERAHSLTSNNNALPYVNYRPKNGPPAESYALFDLSATGIGGGDAANLQEYVHYIYSKYDFANLNAKQVVFVNQKFDGYSIASVDPIECKNIYELADLIYYAKYFFTVHSGAHSLAAAIKNIPGSRLDAIHCCIPKMQFNLRNFVYDNVHYYVA